MPFQNTFPFCLQGWPPIFIIQFMLWQDLQFTPFPHFCFMFTSLTEDEKD